MKQFFIRIGLTFSVLLLCLSAAAAMPSQLVPGGSTVGLQLKTGGVLVVEAGDDSAAPLRQGDRIVKVNGQKTATATDLQQLLSKADGDVTLTVEREGKTLEFLAQPSQTADGPKLGVAVRDSVAGIGTVTYYDPESGAFGALGHGVNDPGTMNLLKSDGGDVLATRVVSVKKGQAGAPGQLEGAAISMNPIGSVEKNTSHGVFGLIFSPGKSPMLPVAKNGEAETGPAQILSNVSGTQVQEFDVEILRIYPTEKETGRNLLLRVTDPELLETTGGIVQGMSGSPILQNGKLIGAVTHVLVNDPTTGYGIFIENMLDAAA